MQLALVKILDERRRTVEICDLEAPFCPLADPPQIDVPMATTAMGINDLLAARTSTTETVINGCYYFALDQTR